MRYTLAALGALTLTLAACSDSPTESPAADGTAAAGGAVVVATTTQLASIADQVAACNGGSATSLMGVGDDPHSFSPSSQQIAQLASADLVVANGLGLEGNLTDTLANAAADGVEVLEIAPLVDPIPFGALTLGSDAHAEHHPGHGDDPHEGHADEADSHEAESAPEEDAHAEGAHADDAYTEDAHEEDGHEGHSHSGPDPHVWHDPDRMAIAAEEIGHHLAEVTGDEGFDSCGVEVADEFRALTDEITEILAVVPDEHRILVVDHEAWGYFADQFGFHMAGVVIPGGSTEAEPSSQELAALVEVIQETGTPAIFANNAGGANTLVDAVAAEVGEIEVVTLYEGSLGDPGSGADTYQDMMRANARAIADALQ